MKKTVERTCAFVEVDTDTFLGLIAKAEKLEDELSDVIRQLSQSVKVKIAPQEQGEEN